MRWKGHSLPYRVFAKDQRVSHTAIVENKRLGHVLRIVKAQQDILHPPTVQTNSSKGDYQKRGRRIYGPRLRNRRAAGKSGGNDELMESVER